jgi:GH24 family phage-related lysozyme (muramidase)
VENRFVEMDREFRGISARSGRGKGTRAFATSSAAGRSFDWARPQSAALRVLVIFIENGGIDLGIPDLVDKILSVLPGSSLLPDDLKQKLVKFLRQQIKSITDNLLESAELAANRYTAAKPDLYSDVVVLRDGTASYSDLKSQLVALSQAGKVIDLFILTHGSDNYISVAGGVDDKKILQMRSESGKPLAIRSVYMMNCVGSSLNGAWLKIGAKVSAGSRGNNYLPEPTMFFFWQNWKAGQSFESAATGAYKATVKLMNDAVRSFLSSLSLPGAPLARAIDFNDFDFVQSSAPVISGKGELTISSDDLSFTESMSTGMATTVVSVCSLSDGDGQSGGATMISDTGVEFVKGWEGFVPNLYNDPVGHCMVGYGTLLHKGNCDGRDSEQPYRDGISQEEATRLLARELGEKQKAVSGAVKVALNQNQYDALVSFAYNVGAGAFGSSTLLKLLNQGKYDAVPGELNKWTKARKDGQLVDLPSLVNRRAAEAALFEKPVAAAQSLAWGRAGRALSQSAGPEIWGGTPSTSETVSLYHYGNLTGVTMFKSPPGYPRLTDCDIATSQAEAAQFTGTPINANLLYKYEIKIDVNYFNKNFRNFATRGAYSEYDTKESIPIKYFTKVADLIVTPPRSGSSPSPTGGAPPQQTPGGGPTSTTPTSARVTAGATLAVLGANIAFNWVIGALNEKRIQRALDAMNKELTAVHEQQSNMGILLIFSFSGGADSGQGPTAAARFERVTYMTALSRDYAMEQWRRQPRIDPPGMRYEFGWIDAISPQAVPPADWGPTALAKFADVSEIEFQRMGFAQIGGFDTKGTVGPVNFSKYPIAKGYQFYVLQIPSSIPYYGPGGGLKHESVRIENRSVAGGTVPAMIIDDTAIAAVVAANADTLGFFHAKGAQASMEIDDKNNALRAVPNIDEVRWLRLKQIQVIKRL